MDLCYSGLFCLANVYLVQLFKEDICLDLYIIRVYFYLNVYCLIPVITKEIVHGICSIFLLFIFLTSSLDMVMRLTFILTVSASSRGWDIDYSDMFHDLLCPSRRISGLYFQNLSRLVGFRPTVQNPFISFDAK
jgi:hypothetical protein